MSLALQVRNDREVWTNCELAAAAAIASAAAAAAAAVADTTVLHNRLLHITALCAHVLTGVRIM